MSWDAPKKLHVVGSIGAAICLAAIANPVWSQSQESANLQWISPTELEDGRTLSDLDHFNIYVNGELTASTDAESFTIDDLPFGTTSFYVTAVRVNGVESLPSNTETKTVVDDVPPLPPVLLALIAALRDSCDRNGVPSAFREVCEMVASL